MTLTIINAATETDLTTLDVVKRELSITSTDNDVFLGDAISQASDVVRDYTGRTFAKETVEETLPASGFPTLVLSRTPIISVTSVTDDGSTISSTSFTIDNADAGILFREKGWTSTRLFTHRIERIDIQHGARDWKVTYEAGYELPGSTGTRTLPRAVERAAIEITKSFYFGRGDNPNIKSQSAGDAMESKFANADGIPPNAKSLLSRWRRLDI